MPRCASGEFCQSPNLPLDDPSFDHFCPGPFCKRQRVVHAGCSLSDEGATDLSDVSWCVPCYNHIHRKLAPAPTLTATLNISNVNNLITDSEFTSTSEAMATHRSAAAPVAGSSTASPVPQDAAENAAVASATNAATAAATPSTHEYLTYLTPHYTMSANRLMPANNMQSIWWTVFHKFKPSHPSNANMAHFACCNICGKTVNLGKDKSTSALKQHVSSCNHNIYEEMLSIKRPSPGGRPKRPDTKTADKSATTEVLAAMPGEGKVAKQAPLPGQSPRKTKAELHEKQEIAAARWLIHSNQNFRVVQTDEFRKMIDTVVAAGNKALRGFSPQALYKRVKELETQVRDCVKRKLKTRKAVLTCDHWTARKRDNGVRDKLSALTIHWIESFELHHATLDLEAQDDAGIGSEDVDTLVAEIEADIITWELSLDNLPFIVSDVTDDKKTAAFGHQVREKLQLETIYCIDNVLQGIADIVFRSNFYGDAEGGDQTSLLNKARSLTEYLSSSAQQLFELKQQQMNMEEYDGEAVGIVTDAMDHRWWSTFRMLDRLLLLRPALAAMSTDGKLKAEYHLSEEEWSELGQINYLLQPFKSAMVYLDDTKFVTVSLVLPIVKIVRDCLDSIVTVAHSDDEGKRADDDDDNESKDNESTNSEESLSAYPKVQECAAVMLAAFDARFGDLDKPFSVTVHYNVEQQQQVGIHWAVLIGHALDPRFKDLHYIKSTSNKQEVWDHLLKLMAEVKLDQKLASGKRKKKRKRADFDPLTASLMAYDNRSVNSGINPAGSLAGDDSPEDDIVVQSCKTELKSYQDAGRLAHFQGNSRTKQNDPLDWWRDNHSRFPRLWRLAELFLCIPAISCPTERAFSEGQQITQNHELTREIIFVRENFQFLPNKP